MNNIIKLGLFILLLVGCTNDPKVCINDECFYVEIADEDHEQKTGLMGRESLDLQKGMLFVYEISANRPFWMLNTSIPLDMIWIDENLKIVFIEKNTVPCMKDCIVYNPKVNSSYVLEINGGLSDTYGFKINDNVEIWRVK